MGRTKMGKSIRGGVDTGMSGDSSMSGMSGDSGMLPTQQSVTPLTESNFAQNSSGGRRKRTKRARKTKKTKKTKKTRKTRKTRKSRRRH